MTKFAYLCPNGTLHPVSPGVEPCVWLRQPWPLIVSSSDRSVELARRINGWLQNPSFSVWQTAFKEIISADELVVVDSTIQGPRDAMQPCKYCVSIKFKIYPVILLPDSIHDFRDIIAA